MRPARHKFSAAAPVPATCRWVLRSVFCVCSALSSSGQTTSLTPRMGGGSQCQTLFLVFVEFEGRSCSTDGMLGRPRIEFEGAIYHVMARGNGRQQIVRDDHDRERLLDDLPRTVLRRATRGVTTRGVRLCSWF